MRQQYGLRIKSAEFEDMDWEEFSDLIAGLNDQTPLVKLAQIRTADAETLKQLTPEQRRIHAEWQKRRAKSRKEQETRDFLRTMQKTLTNLFGGQ